MIKPGPSFFGNPTYSVKDKDIARMTEMIEAATSGQSKNAALRTATSAIHAITAFVASRYGLKEILAILDRLRTEIMGTQV